MRALLILALLATPLLAGCLGSDDEPAATTRNETRTFTLGPGESVEYKLSIKKGEKLDYAWTSPRALAYDFHGDTGGDAYTSHKKGTATTDKGVFTVPFDGRHGWYWKNNNRAEVEVTLTTKGTYGVVGVVG